jgi:cytochrome b involved in lipid metabolism
MPTPRILLGITLVVLVGVVVFAALARKDSTTTNTPPAAVVVDTTNNTPETASTTTASNNTQTPAPVTSGYTMANIAEHANASSCWVAINGKVYDLTSWISQHPGGPDRILSICGTDSSAAFNGQHSGDPRPAKELKSFLLGPLSQ